jgi:hypothetical protein
MNGYESENNVFSFCRASTLFTKTTSCSQENLSILHNLGEKAICRAMNTLPRIAGRADGCFQSVMLMGFYHQKCVRSNLWGRTPKLRSLADPFPERFQAIHRKRYAEEKPKIIKSNNMSFGPKLIAEEGKSRKASSFLDCEDQNYVKPDKESFKVSFIGKSYDVMQFELSHVR